MLKRCLKKAQNELENFSIKAYILYGRIANNIIIPNVPGKRLKDA
jgi:hypothetical protein